MSAIDTVRQSFAAYRRQDKTTAERLLADDFVFTSPQDDHIDKTAWLQLCFPTADRFRSQEILHLVSTGEDERVLLVYEYELADGRRYRNAERIRVRDGQLVETEVFFGGSVA